MSDEQNPASNWIKREVSLGNLLLIMCMMGSVGVGIWQGSAIRTTLEDGIKAETSLRLSEETHLNDRINALHDNVREVAVDVRELRNLMYARNDSGPHRQPPP